MKPFRVIAILGACLIFTGMLLVGCGQEDLAHTSNTKPYSTTTQATQPTTAVKNPTTIIPQPTQPPVDPSAIDQPMYCVEILADGTVNVLDVFQLTGSMVEIDGKLHFAMEPFTIDYISFSCVFITGGTSDVYTANVQTFEHQDGYYITIYAKPAGADYYEDLVMFALSGDLRTCLISWKNRIFVAGPELFDVQQVLDQLGHVLGDRLPALD